MNRRGISHFWDFLLFGVVDSCAVSDGAGANLDIQRRPLLFASYECWQKVMFVTFEIWLSMNSVDCDCPSSRTYW